MADIPDDVLDQVERAHGGHIWSEVRSGLSRYRERLVQAFDAGSYERESAILDDIARAITANVEPLVDRYAALRKVREKTDERL